jgi:hypothetical protein
VCVCVCVCLVVCDLETSKTRRLRLELDYCATEKRLMYVCMHALTCVHMFVCTYLCTNVCMSVCTYVLLLFLGHKNYIIQVFLFVMYLKVYICRVIIYFLITINPNKISHVLLLTFIGLRATSLSYDVAHRTVRS